MPFAQIEAIALGKSFPGRVLFADVSFRLGAGVLAVVGPNGSGKTTLLKILAGLIRPSSGAVRIEREGRDVEGDERRRAVGWAGPDLAFYPELTAEDNLVFFERAAGFPSARARVRSRLAQVGLSGAEGPVEHFSTGMKQRLRVAFATLLDPSVLLLDEPFAGLDDAGREIVRRSVADAARERPVVLASTGVEDLPESTRVLELGSGGAAHVPR